MSTIQKFASLREAQKWAKEAVLEAAANDSFRPVYVLRRDGDTDVYAYSRQSRRVEHRRECGWVTLGNTMSPSDMPCIIC